MRTPGGDDRWRICLQADYDLRSVRFEKARTIEREVERAELQLAVA